MLSDSNSLQLSSFHHSIQEDFVEDKHVSIRRSDLLNPLDLHFVCCCLSRELNIDFRKVRKIWHGVEAVSIDYKDLEFLSEFIFGSSDKFSHDHWVIWHFRLNLENIFVDSIVSRGGVEFEREVVGKEFLWLSKLRGRSFWRSLGDSKSLFFLWWCLHRLCFEFDF